MKRLYFFIGTEAELMKMFSVIKKCRESGFDCKLVITGQNNVINSPFLELSGSNIDIDLSKYRPKRKSAIEYVKWLFFTELYGIKVMKKLCNSREKKENALVIVHGDTLSTLLSSRIARKSGLKYVHIESGLRSYNWFVPFPEEIDRYFSSKYSAINFCPKQEYTKNANKFFKGEAVCTNYNTGIETLLYALEKNKGSDCKPIFNGKYYVLAIHRQENLVNIKYMTTLVSKIELLSTAIHCIFIYHSQTEDALKKFGLWKRVANNNNITLVQRLPYLNFISVVDKCEFVIADGAGNQQEFFYMGKPYLIMRTDFEKDSEGLGYNAKGFDNDFDNILKFYDEYKNYNHNTVNPHVLPSDIIVNKLIEKYK